MLRFTVSTLLAETSPYDLLVFHLASDEHYLTLQRRADGQPSRFGLIRCECDGQTRSGYDVIRRLEAGPDQLRLWLDPARAAPFDGECEYCIDLAIDPADKPAALRFLRRFFQGTTLLHETTSSAAPQPHDPPAG